MKKFKRILKDTGVVLLMVSTYLLASLGTVFLAITLINPVNLWWAMSPIETPYYIITYSSVMTYLELIQQYYWYSVGLSFTSLVLAYAIHIRSLRQLWNGIKATPKAILYSPMTLYKDIVEFRDWLFNKIEYLNAESAKWKRFFNVMKSPYSLLRSLGVNPQLAIAILGIGGATGGTLVVAEVIQERSFANGDAGIYMAPSNLPSEELEKELAWRKDNPQDNTLRIILNTTPVEEVNISNVNIGTSYASNGQPSALPSGKTEAILVDGNNTRLEIGKLTFSRNSCKTLSITDVIANKITIKDNQSDGHSITQSATSTVPNLRISGGNYMSKALVTESGTYDRLWISAEDSLTSSNARINTMTLDNIVSTGGTCDFKKLSVGELVIEFNRIGGDSSLVTKALTISSTVKSANWSVTGNMEVLMAEVARMPD